MSIIDNIQKRKNAETTKAIDSLLAQFANLQDVDLSPINQTAVYGLKDFKENEKILKIDDKTQKPIVLLVDKKDLPLSKRLCYLDDLNVKSNFSYIYNVDINDNYEKDYRLSSITEYEKAALISQVIDQCMNSFENKKEEKLLRDLQLYARNCTAASVLIETVKLLRVCDKNNGVYIDAKSANYSLKLLKELQADYNELPIKKFIAKYEKAHEEITNKYVPAALEFLSKQIQTANMLDTTPAQPLENKEIPVASVAIDESKATTSEVKIDLEKRDEIFSKMKNHSETKKEKNDPSEQSNEKTA